MQATITLQQQPRKDNQWSKRCIVTNFFQPVHWHWW